MKHTNSESESKEMSVRMEGVIVIRFGDTPNLSHGAIKDNFKMLI